ncbi:hypothetical protein BCR39DRAFT_589357 [Naematelia encephala]|uniref:Pectate lyase superfamily protein domain-containing protein n=1 Tax=Naematelia encephala TaxID=71784 RepID=A0A1Y2AX31_9TREE|nr:hypothetical protein BCR39DRAFT_589357 [Naematelia encephala]
MSVAILVALLPLIARAADLSTITPAPQPTGLLGRQNSVGTTYETTSPLPLTEYFYPYDQIPYQVNPFPVGRGPQSGYNQCNSTTEGPDSQCQTLIVNSIDDFCGWGAPGTTPNDTIGDVEAAVVAYCTKSGHGARVLPPGAFTAVQFIRTDAYIQITGWVNQTAFNLAPNDTGGELDPHGADQLGNPLGGLAYSNGFYSGDNTTYLQTQSWNHFIGADVFCIKLCNPDYNTTANYCQNIYDLLGCQYNMPASYEQGVFLSCDGDLQDEVGTYTSDGQTITWHQPSSLDPTDTIPFTPRIPATSNCQYYQSTDLYPTESLGYQSTAAPLNDIGLTTTPATPISAFATISAASTATAINSVATGSSGSRSSSGSSSGSRSGSASSSGSSNTPVNASASSSTSGATRSFGANLNSVATGLAYLLVGLTTFLL